MEKKQEKERTQRPDFLIIMTDQFHPGCLGYAGHPVVQTPNIDALASQSMNFTRMYCSTPLCMPARATLFTGLTLRGHRVRMNGIGLDPTTPTFTEALGHAGYITHNAGKIHLSPGGLTSDIDLNCIGPGMYPESRSLWISGMIKQYPPGRHGLQHVDFLGGCAHGTYGPYLDWLKNNHPDKAHLFFDKVTLEPPGPAEELFNRNSYKWALPAALHPAAWVADRTIDFLNRITAQRKQDAGSKPFCTICSIQEPHPPFAPPAEYAYRYDPKDVPPAVGRQNEYDDLPPHFRQMYETDIVTSGNNGQPMKATAPFRNECAAHYYGLIELVDNQVGRVLKCLDENNLADNTVVIFLADHGEALGDHGMWGKGPYHFDSVIRVPFLVKWPGRVKEHSTHDQPTDFLDFAPTILDAAGVPIPEGTVPRQPESPNAPSPSPGCSLVPVLTGGDSHSESSALVEMDEDYLGFKMRTLVTRRYRLTCYSGKPYGELFDLQEDPNELYNLWDDPSKKNTRDELRLLLLDKIMQTDISLPRQVSRA